MPLKAFNRFKEVQLIGKKIAIWVAIACSLPLSMPMASAAEEVFKGKVLGLQCFQGKVDCESDMYKYAHIAYEPDFVLAVNPEKHYMLSNISRSLKQSLAGSDVIITGSLIRKNTTIDVSEIKMKIKGSTVLVWSEEIEKEKKKALNKSLYGH